MHVEMCNFKVENKIIIKIALLFVCFALDL